MSELDMRMNLNVVNQFQLSKSEEITAVAMNESQDTLVTGFKDGTVKIYTVGKYYSDDSASQQK